jgi:hypothetical protein
VTESNYIDISTLLGQNTVTERCDRGVTGVTKSQGQILSELRNKKFMIIKNSII